MRIGTIQALRAAAALSVVVLHMLHEAIAFDPGGTIAAAHDALPWAAGVDLFFVISGFIMVQSSAGLFGQRGAAWVFLRHRLTRIVPLYWLATALFVAAAAAVGGVRDGVPGWTFLAASLAFIPWAGPDGVVQPVLSLGWTLEFEMLFYAVFAVCIGLTRPRAVAAVAVVLLAAVALHPWATGIRAAYWTEPVLLEFLLGMAVAVARPLMPRWPAALRVAAALVSVLALAGLAPAGPAPLRAGLPLALLLLAAVAGNDPAPSRAWRWLVALGDTSYALYLVHPFPMRAAALIAGALHGRGPVAAAGVTLAGTAAAILAALAVHRWIERPIARVLRGR